MGNRWRSNEKITRLKNVQWTDVFDVDKVESLAKNPNLCENSCYW